MSTLTFTQHEPVQTNRLILRMPRLAQLTSTDQTRLNCLIVSNDYDTIVAEFSNYNFTGLANTSLVSYACVYGRASILRWLLEHGAPVDSTTHFKECTYSGYFELFDILVEFGGEIRYNNDEILFYITGFLNKPYYERTKRELPQLIAKYGLEKHRTNCGFASDGAETSCDGC